MREIEELPARFAVEGNVLPRALRIAVQLVGKVRFDVFPALRQPRQTPALHGGRIADQLPKRVGRDQQPPGKAVGGAAQVNGPTYDQATILVGMKADGTITGLQFLKNTDSPGFGLKANDPTFTLSNGKTFYGQFEGKNAKDGFKLGETFDAISGATITSNGVANLLTEGTGSLLKYLEKQGASNE